MKKLVFLLVLLLTVSCGPARHTHTVMIRDGEITPESIIRCPKCGGTDLSTNNRGYSVGKGFTGGLLFGPVGLLFGASGSWKSIFICMSCGYTWKPDIVRTDEGKEDKLKRVRVNDQEFPDGIYK